MKPLVLSFSISLQPSPTFGEDIRKVRLDKHWKQDDVAQLAGIAESTISNRESYLTLPLENYRNVERLCEILEIVSQDLESGYRTGVA